MFRAPATPILVDLLRGHYEILGLGLPAPWHPEYARLLRERYGIQERVVAGCVVSKSLLAYVEGYNSVTMSAANRKFRRDIFHESIADASRNWNLRQPPRSLLAHALARREVRNELWLGESISNLCSVN
jgi:hypothetical protein